MKISIELFDYLKVIRGLTGTWLLEKRPIFDFKPQQK